MQKNKIAFDLDGVIINKPPFVPKKLIEYLYRSHTNHKKKYRYPKLKAEILLRKLSHHWLFRPPIKNNLSQIKKIFKNNKYDIYFISGRYSFLKNRTRQWFKQYFPEFDFKKVFINEKNLQPHVFKEKKLKELKIKHFFDDDEVIIKYLKKKTKTIIVSLINHENSDFSNLLSA